MTREEAILDARRKLEAGEFQRAVVKIVPADVGYDRLTLECGHSKAWMPGLVLNDKKALRERCVACAEEWITKSSGAEPDPERVG
jgi:hypothetical protein